MWKNRVLLLLVGAALIVILYSLPKVVVDNEQNEITPESPDQDTDFHQSEASPGEKQRVLEFKTQLEKTNNIEKSSIFADSLAEAFRAMNQWDSAAYYLGRHADRFETRDNLVRAGEAYFQAQGFAISQSEIERLGQQARMFFDKVLDQNPGDLDVKTKIGLTYIASSNPMQGIMVLREVLEADPNNEMALYNMGILSMQSSQWERAVERFTKLIEVNPVNSKAHFYLGLSYLELNQKQLAKVHLMKVKELEKDPEILANVDSYLEDIEN